eukprot:scaffold272769_cov31-Tisochrysis_lutea.AAC.2
MVPDPDGELVHPIRRNQHVVANRVDCVLGILLGGGHHHRGAFLGRHLRVGENHGRCDPQRRLALEVHTLGCILAMARARKVLDVALCGRVAGKEWEGEAGGSGGLVHDGARLALDHSRED